MMSEMNIRKELAVLERMTPGELREKYRELFGDESRSGNRQWLYRRCAWRLQALAQGGPCLATSSCRPALGLRPCSRERII